MRATPFRGMIAVALVATAAMGCIHRSKTEDGFVPFDAITTAHVTNKNWFDLKVYVLRAGGQAGSHSLVGIAKAFSTQVFELPRDVLESRKVQISLQPIGSPQAYLTGPILVTPGQRIHLVVPERLNQTYYSVFDP